MDLNEIRKRMNRSRTDMRQTVRSAKAVAFCDDPAVFNWVCRDYRYNYEVWNGNVEAIHSGTYEAYFNLIADGTNYRMALESLKEDYENDPSTEVKYLLDSMTSLRKRYKVR